MSSTLPDFVIAGAQRCATTWLQRCMQEHPDICMSSEKEINFFSSDENWGKGVTWYERHFRDCSSTSVIGEASVDYLYRKDAIGRIAAVIPDCNIVVVLRNPIDRAYSAYCHLYREEKSAPTFNEALEIDADLIARGFYGSQLANLFSHFSREDVIVVFYEELVRSNTRTIQKILSFLGLPTEIDLPSVGRRYNTSTFTGGNWWHEAIWIAKGVFEGSMVENLGRELLFRYRERCDRVRSSEIDREKLADLFAVEVRRTESILEEPVPWEDFE